MTFAKIFNIFLLVFVRIARQLSRLICLLTSKLESFQTADDSKMWFKGALKSDQKASEPTRCVDSIFDAFDNAFLLYYEELPSFKNLFLHENLVDFSVNWPM